MWISLGVGLWLWGHSGLKASRRSFLDWVNIRLVTVATALVIFLTAGWIRAARGRP